MTVVYRNRTAVYAWGVALVFLLVVLAFSLVFLRDGPPAGLPPPISVGLLALFWLFGLGGAGHAASQPCLTVTIRPDATLRLVWRYPFQRRERTVPLAGVAPAVVVTARDDDGDPYYLARAELPDGTRLDLWEGHDRTRCEAVCAEFSRALESGP